MSCGASSQLKGTFSANERMEAANIAALVCGKASADRQVRSTKQGRAGVAAPPK